MAKVAISVSLQKQTGKEDRAMTFPEKIAEVYARNKTTPVYQCGGFWIANSQYGYAIAHCHTEKEAQDAILCFYSGKPVLINQQF